MKVEIEKKVKIELDSKETKLLIEMLSYVLGHYRLEERAYNFQQQLKQELER